MKNTSPVVVVEHLSKSFKIPLEASSGLKQKLINYIKGRKGYRKFTPLNDISFTIEKGDFFGIVGKNGSGKSTLLKTIAGIYSPSSGDISVSGRLVPFIELGVGFNPELTGRENVYLNGALLGFSHKEMQQMYDDIVDFAELKDFMEERLKNYSSGMQVRLAFSIAIRAEGDILLLDEVLAVGDEAFQRKCSDYFEQLKRNGKTVILVTHDMAAVEKFCNKAMFINKGKIVKIGQPNRISALYSKLNNENYKHTEVVKSKLNAVSKQNNYNLKVQIQNHLGKEYSTFTSGESMYVKMTWDNTKVSDVSVTIVNQSGLTIFGSGTYSDKFKMKTYNSIIYKINLDIQQGSYYLRVGLGEKDNPQPVAMIDEGLVFIVNKNTSANRWDGISYLEHTWRQ